MISRRIFSVIVSASSIGLCSSCSSNPGSGAPAPQATAAPISVEITRVISKTIAATVPLPGELQPYEVVAVFPKVTAFVDWIGVDRGSVVKSGQLMARLVAPEIAAQRAEAQSKLQGAEAQRLETEAKLASDESTYDRLKSASATPGVVAGNDLIIAQKVVDGDKARLEAAHQSADAAKSALRSVEEVQAYLQVRAPFDGIVTERNVHRGALVGPTTGSDAMPLVRVEKTDRLRLIVPVPEKYVGGISEGANVHFTVPAFPNETFSGTIARIAHSVDMKTCTMPVEMDVINRDGRLAPGMFPEVLWPVHRADPTLVVPATSVARTTEGTFVVRLRDGNVDWVTVQTGESDGKLVEVFGKLQPGDEVAIRGTDELRPGTRVTTKGN